MTSMFSRLYTAGGVAGGRHHHAPSMAVGTEDKDGENQPRGKIRPPNRRSDGDHDHDASGGRNATTAPSSRGGTMAATMTKRKKKKKKKKASDEGGGGEMGPKGMNAARGKIGTGDVVVAGRIGKVGISSSSSSTGMGGRMRYKGHAPPPSGGNAVRGIKMTSLNRRSAIPPLKKTATNTTTTSHGLRFFRGGKTTGTVEGTTTSTRTRTEWDMRMRRKAPDVTVLDVYDDGCGEMVGVECKFSFTHESSTNATMGGERKVVVDDGGDNPSSAVYTRRYALTTIEGESVVIAKGGEEEGRIALPPDKMGRGGNGGRTTDYVGCDSSDSCVSSSASEDVDLAAARLGKAGWHRALTSIAGVSPTFTTSSAAAVEGRSRSPPNRLRIAATTGRTNATLDHLAVTQFLKNSCPSRTGDDEYDAITQEYMHLLREARCLEMDRLELERMFHAEARRVRRTEKDEDDNEGGEKTMTYRSFRTNLEAEDRVHGVDQRLVSSLPVTWLEDALLLDRTTKEEGERKKKERKRSSTIPLSERRLRMMRDFRGTGLALIFADPVCEASILERYGHSDVVNIRSATLIDNGGEHLTHCAITGIDKITREDATSEFDTSFFLKFDLGHGNSRSRSQRRTGAGGVNHLLPPNLVERLIREGRDRASIRYLSTGASYTSGISVVGRGGSVQVQGRHRCYYVEFDDGECWWCTNGDDVLDKVFTKMDVHRVAFGGVDGVGSKSSWIVIGKNGFVTWRNVPRGLHNFLIALKSAAVVPLRVTTAANKKTKAVICPASADSAPCEVSLGMDETYFVRLLDGSVDYSLPNFVAEVIDKLEADGKKIVNVALHVDTFDCFIRYSLREEG